jgi:WD40 repeat protein
LAILACLVIGGAGTDGVLAAPAPTRPTHVQLLLDLQGFSGAVRDLAFSPNGTMLAASGGQEVRIWDVRTGRLLRTVRGDIGPQGYGDCLAVAFSHDGCELVVGIRGRQGQGALRVYDVRNIAQLKELIPGVPGPVTQLAFSRKGRFLAVGCEGGKVVIYDWPFRRVAGSLELAAAGTPAFRNIRFPADEPLLLAWGPGGTAVVSVPGAQVLASSRRLPPTLGRWLAEQSRVGPPFRGQLVSLDWRLERGSWLAGGSGQADGREQHWAGYWTDAGPAPTMVYGKHQYAVNAVALNGDCSLAASADVRGEVHVWDTKTGHPRFVSRSMGLPVYHVAWDASSRRLGFATTRRPADPPSGNQDGAIDRVFDFERRAMVPASATDFPRDGRGRAADLSVTQSDGGYRLRLVTPEGGAVQCDLGPDVTPTCFTLLQTPQLGIARPVVVGDRDGRLFCYDPVGQTPRRELAGHFSCVTSVSESADGRFLVSSSTDRTMRLWALSGTARDRIEPVLNLFLAGPDDWILWTPQGYYDASPGGGELLGWHVNRGPDHSAAFYPVHQFRGQLYRPDIVHQALATGSAEAAIQQAGSVAVDPTSSAPPPWSPATDLRNPQTMQQVQPPRVRILSPQEGTVTQEGQIHVLAEVASENELPITAVRVLVNGRPGLEKGVSVVADDPANRRRISVSHAVALSPGENEVSILASNEVASSGPVTVRVNYNAPDSVLSLKPDLHLLSIGISEYRNQQLNLRFAHLDARDFAAAWEGQRGLVYPNISQTLLLNSNASGEQIRRAMNQFVQGVKRHDVAVIFVSAHGIRDRQLEYYLATHEVDPDRLPETALHFSTIGRFLEALPCKVLLFVDTCHAAGITGAKSIARDPLYELTSDEYGAIVFSSSLSREISVENEKWGHGAFTKAILDTLSNRQADLNRDGFLSLTELEQSVCERVQELTKGQQHPVMKRPATIHNIPFFRLGPADSRS